MKKGLPLLLSVLVLLNSYSVIFATEDEEVTEESVCATGSFEMESEQLTAFLNEIPMIVDVMPNQLYNERLNEESGIIDESFSGGNFNLADDGNEIITNIDNTPLTLTVDEISYPSKVDNSGETTFPVIKDQGNLNSCLGWSLAYYQLTNNANKIRGTAARSGSSNVSSRVYSPNWVYNLGNSGNNNGMNGKSATNVLYTFGCPTINKVPISTKDSTASNYLSWYPTASVWENAIYNKCDLYYGTVNPDNLDTPITSPNSQYLNNIKKLLADGYVVTIETFVNTSSNNYLPVTKTGKTSTGSSAYTWTEVRDNDSVFGHAVTIVGYDDNFKVDIDGNGSYKEAEYGAFKIANSWGTNVSKHNNGYVWLSYDALNAVSSVKKSVHSERVPAFRNGNIFYFVKPQKEYKPLLTATVGFNTRYRDELNVKLGITDTENPSNYFEKNITSANYITDNSNDNHLDRFIAFGYGGGSYNLSGTSSKSTGYVTFDFTSLLQEYELKHNHNYNIYIKLYNYSDTDTTINSFTLKDHNTGNTFTSEEIPQSSNNSNSPTVINVPYLSSISTAKQDKTFTLTFNSKIDETTVDDTIVTLTNSNEDYFNLDLSLSENDEQIILNKQSGYFTNDFYTINIFPELRSKGGNNLTTTISYPFYVPFH